MFTNQLEQFQSMYKEGTADFFNHGFYYPATSENYQYICTGYESAGDYEDHPAFLNLDGHDVQFTASSNEILPYVYYAPDYGYTQSPYNPYNPYIPGASIGADGSFAAPTQCYTFPSYENLATSPAYMAMVLQSRPDVTANGPANTLVDDARSVNNADGLVAKHSQKSVARVFEGKRSSAGFGKQHLPSQPSTPYVQAARGLQGTENRKVPLANSQSEVALAHKGGQNFYGRVPNDAKVDIDALSEPNQGSGIYKDKKQLVVKAYTSRAGNADTRGNITIYTDQYNRVDFPLVYKNAKFFVIKSYSEDDVHKSIKYNVWSSTLNGNRKLNAAYEDAQKLAAGDSRGCPIFLMFSVNASGQFCGVAEMTGAVDPNRDMDFWQQDKWNGSFPVKWHIIKDVPNSSFRHIILENNENKPVTNSRDTQEINYKKGLEMLKIFQNYSLKASLLDDFMYYENRQHMLQEERAKLSIKSSVISSCIPPISPNGNRSYASIQNIKDSKQHDANDSSTVNAINCLSIQNIKDSKQHDANNLSTANPINFSSEEVIPTGQVSLDSLVSKSASVNENGQVSAGTVPSDVDKLQISSLNINSKVPETRSLLHATDASVSTNSKFVEAVTIGSVLVKVSDVKSSGLLAAQRR